MKKLIVLVIICLFCIQTVYAEETVEVTLPDFDVTLNGMVVDNENEPYPFIVYKGITYLPMTWDMSYALGLELKWSDITGLKVAKRNIMKPYVRAEEGMNTSATLKAKLVEFPVNVNGQQVDNVTAEYPLLNYRNVTYFPMTYAYMVGEFGSVYQWDDEKGLYLAADGDLDVFFPQAQLKTFSIDFDDFTDDDLLVDDMVKLLRTGETSLGVQVISGTHPEYDGFIIDVKAKYYTRQGDYICSLRYPTSRMVYDGINKSSWTPRTFYIQDPLFDAVVEIEVSLEPKEISLARSIEQYPDVEFEYMSDQGFNLDRIKAMGAKYIEAVDFMSHENLPKALVAYDAMSYHAGSMIDDSNKRYDVLKSNITEYVAIARSDKYIALDQLTRLYIDPTLPQRERLILEKNDTIVYTLPDGAIRLYDKDKQLIKVLISDRFE